MHPIEVAVEQAGYYPVNLDYDSLSAPIEVLAPRTTRPGLAECKKNNATPIHFITHSMGGILLRYYLKHNSINDIGNSILIAPPNAGSEIVDTLVSLPLINKILGPAGRQLGTDPTDLPLNLGDFRSPFGIIAGDRTSDPVLSLLLPEPNDGRVSVASTRLPGMSDFIILHYSHTNILQSRETISQVLSFLRHQKFNHDKQLNPP